MKRFLSATTAIALSLAIAPRPAVGNPAALAAPAACATGVGCVVVGSVVVGGVLYYIWRNQGSGQEYRMAAEAPGRYDPPAASDREVAIYGGANRCYELARQYNRIVVRVEVKRDATGTEYHVCHFR